MLWNSSEHSHNYYWLSYGADLLQHKNTSCYSMSWEGLLDILKLKFNPSFHKEKKKKRPECQHHSSCIECTWGVYNTQQDRYSSLLKRLIFKISLFQLYLVSIYHTVSGFPGIDHVETGNYMKVYVLTMFNSTQVLLKASTVLLPPSGRSQNCKYL